MILLNVNISEKNEVKAIHGGARWDPNLINPVTNRQGCWYAPDNKAYLYQKWMINERTTFEDLFLDVSKQVNLTKKLYTFDAEVHDGYRGTNDAYFFYTLFTGHNLRRIIRAKVPAGILGTVKPSEFIYKQVQVTGYVFLYGPSLTFQVDAIEFKIVDKCTRLKELELWTAQCKPLFHEDAYRELKGIRKVGLVTNKTSQGYHDFVDRIRELPKENIILKNVSLKIDEIIQAIKELNAEGECNVICIIRGGGDPEVMHEYSRPDFLKAIFDSKIPVITGIGHANDQLLCSKVAYYHARTPTDAANYINTQVNKDKAAHKKQTAQAQAVRSGNDWKTRCMIAEAEVEELKAKIEALEIQVHDLEAKKEEKPGLLSRIFNW